MICFNQDGKICSHGENLYIPVPFRLSIIPPPTWSMFISDELYPPTDWWIWDWLLYRLAGITAEYFETMPIHDYPV